MYAQEQGEACNHDTAVAGGRSSTRTAQKDGKNGVNGKDRKGWKNGNSKKKNVNSKTMSTATWNRGEAELRTVKQRRELVVGCLKTAFAGTVFDTYIEVGAQDYTRMSAHTTLG
jgi:hypothetical protein